MVSQNRQIDLVSKVNPDVFKLINKDIFGNLDQRIGSVQGAVNRILMQYEQMLKTLMPPLITTTATDPLWYKRVSNYWNSFGLVVPIGGKKLETGFNFDLGDVTRKTAITELLATAKKAGTEIKSDTDLRDYINANITEFEKYKYASPINASDYLTWVFCLGHREVANKSQDIEKSTNIKFVLIDPKDIVDAKRVQHTLSIEATKKYLEIITDRKRVKDILYIQGENASKLDDLDADAKLKQFSDSKPKEFLAIANDKNTVTRAGIERYCIIGILRRLPNSSIIVDALDNGVVIGNTTDEAVAYFSSESADKSAKVKEFGTRYAQLVKT